MLVIGREVKRNLQEQVAENMKQIGLIWQKLDGLDVYDNVIIIEDLSNLNEEQLAIIARPVSFIVYQDVVYVKKGNVGAYALFSPFYSIETDEYITIKSSELRVQFPLGEVTISNLDLELYDKTQTDALLGDKADKDDTYNKSEVDALLLSKVYPVGAIYISNNNTSPASLFGGTWEALNSGNTCKLVTSNDALVKAGTTISSPGTTAMHFKASPGNLNTRSFSVGYWGGNTGELKVIAEIGSSEPGQKLIPDNLHATLSSVNIYAWKRVA